MHNFSTRHSSALFSCQIVFVVFIVFSSQQFSIASKVKKEEVTQVEDDKQSISKSTSHLEENSIDYYSDEYINELESLESRLKLVPFTISDNADDIKFLLFRDATNVNQSEELILNDMDSIKGSTFKPKEMSVFVIHGFWSSGTSGMPVVIKNAYLEAGVPYNIIVVDWGKLSSPDPKEEIYSPLAYPIIVRRSIPIVYNRVAEFIQFLVDNKYASLDRIHVVGHSLGAHISGGAGNVIASNSANNGQRVARITGLDPAGPLFQGIRIQRRLSRKDAKYVDIYHTAAGTLGNVIRREGDADFFPNGGHHQPGCVDFESPLFFEADFGSCSHSFATKIYAASITRNFTACQCDPLFLDFIAGSVCPGNCTVSVLAGERCPPNAMGQFYFETSKDPFNPELEM